MNRPHGQYINKGLHLSLCMRSRRAIPVVDKLHVAARQQWKCANCKNTLTEFFEIDHILAIALGGDEDTLTNLQALCSDCHRHKTLFDIRKVHKLRKGGHSRVICTTHTPSIRYYSISVQ